MQTKFIRFSTFALVTGACVFAIAQPTQPGDNNNGNGNSGNGQQMQDPYHGYQAPGGYTQNDYPSSEVNVVPPARANAVRARLEAELIQTNLHRWIDRSWDDFMHSKDYNDASGTEKQAADAYNKERERVLMKLRNDDKYLALSDLVNQMNSRLDAERPHSIMKASFENVENMMALATVKLGYQSQLSAMEAAALNADSGVQNSRQKLMDAANKTRDMRRDFDRSVRHDPEFVAERTRYEEAHINFVVADAYLQSALNARCIALDYAYYVHGWDQYKWSTGYYNTPYGYGYGAGFNNGGFMRRY